MTKTKFLSYCAFFAALTAVLSQISVPVGPVPVNLALMSPVICAALFGVKTGFTSQTVFVLLGAVGLPVFAGFKGGLGIVLGLTGGFIVSFPIMAFLAGLGLEMGGMVKLYAGLVAGAVINYIIGTCWFVVAAHSTFAAAFAACVLPFIPTAIIKIILAGIIGKKVRELLIKAGAI